MTKKNTKKSKKSASAILLDISIVVLVIVFLVSGYLAYDFFKKTNDVSKETDELQEIVKDNLGTTATDKTFTKQSYAALKKINDDFVAYIDFENNLLSLPIVQAGDNDYYLRKNFNKAYSVLGVPFVDYKCSELSENYVIYGHNSAYSETAMFSPIRSLLDKPENFNNNDRFKLYFEDEVREYQIVAMYYFAVDTDNGDLNHDYTVTGWDTKTHWQNYFSWVEQRNLIKANTKYSYGDHFATLQTCRSWHENERLVIVAKELGIYPYE